MILISPGLPCLIPPFLYFLLSISLFHHFLLPPPPSPTTSPFHRFFPFTLTVFSLSLFVISLFHLNYQTPLSTLPNHLFRQHSLPNTHPIRQQTVPPGTPQVPSPVVTPPSPTPSPSPVPSPPAQQPLPPVTNAPATAVPSDQPTNNQADTTSSTSPSLDECGGGLVRMQVLLLLEFFAECIFLLMRCLATDPESEDPICDISFRTFTMIRAIYTIPVIALNASILFIGSGPTGSCLQAHPGLQVAYAHLILYALFTMAFVIFGLHRLKRYDSEKDSSTPTGFYGYSSYTASQLYPPSRTESYYHSRTRHTPPGSSYYSDDRRRPRINCGCCEIRF